ncbi:MAG: hypothetical protein U0031_12255 [Thermomicrobiales bacterium]
MLDPTTVTRDRLEEKGRWGSYVDDHGNDPTRGTETGSANRWVPWLVLLVIAAVVVAFLVANPL